MEIILSFLADNYLYFIIGAVILLFALIGFAVDGKKKNKTDGVEMNPTNTMPNTGMQFGQSPNVTQNNVPNTEVPQVPTELNNGMSTGFDQFTSSNVQEAPAVNEPVQNNAQANANAEEAVSFGPIPAENNESIFTEPPVVNETDNEALTFEMPNNEPKMEALDLGTPQVNETPNEPMPVSMTPEVPTQNEVPAPAPQVQEQQAPEMPPLNNTLQ